MGRSREGSVYRRKDGRWVASVTLPGPGRRKRTTSYHPTERAALAARRKMLREVEAGRLADDCTVTDWIDYWLDHIAPEKASPRTVSGYASHHKNWIKPQIGSRKLSQLRPEDVRKLRRHIETTPRLTSAHKPLLRDGKPVMHSPTTVRSVLVTLTAALNAALRERRITWNPADSVAKPQAEKNHHAWLTTQDAGKVISAAETPLEQARLAVALYAGLRQGEALALTWDHIDLDARVIRVRQSTHRVKGQGMVVKAKLKNEWSRRDVPMHTLVASTLAALDGTGFVFGDTRPPDSTRDHHAWKAACRRAGVPEVPLHGARATTATMLREAGVPLSTIGAILGHKPGSPITGLSYAHAQDAELRQAIELLP